MGISVLESMETSAAIRAEELMQEVIDSKSKLLIL